MNAPKRHLPPQKYAQMKVIGKYLTFFQVMILVMSGFLEHFWKTIISTYVGYHFRIYTSNHTYVMFSATSNILS